MKEIVEFANSLTNIPFEEITNYSHMYAETKEKLRILENNSEDFPDKEATIILFYSFLYYENKEHLPIINILKIILKSKTMSHYRKFFYFYQLVRVLFLDVNISNNKEISNLMKELYKEIFDLFKSELNISENHIPLKERNKDLVFIITSQFLALEHGPTKTTLDRAVNLYKYFNKQVIIINAADLIPTVDGKPFFNLATGNIVDDYSKISRLTMEDGLAFQFYQPKKPMPNIDEIRKIINSIIQYKPYFILNIGETLISDLCSLFVPTIAQTTVPSSVPLTFNTFSVVGNPKLKLTENMILSTFTFWYKPQTHTYKKSDFSLPEDKFLIIVSGGRLTDEVTYDFLYEIREIFNYNAHIVFAGKFDTYEQIISKDNILKENTTFLGFQDDMLAVTELCDLYINPPRTGGGTSIAEALAKGKPAVTLNFGDCSISAGEDFCVETLSEMKDMIIKYITDKKFYAEMSEKALKRNELLTDTKKSLEHIITSVEKSKLWW